MRLAKDPAFCRPSLGARLAALATLAVVALAGGPVRAEVASARRPVSLITPGPSLEMGLDGSLRFGGEIALAQYTGSSGLGGALGFVSGRLYLEVQPALVLGDRHNLVLGLNPGLVIDVTGDLPRYGGQVTLWTNYVRSGASRWALPLFPFVRVQLVVGMGAVLTGGIMLKLPLPIS
jgi:hypothetical protein